MAVDGDILKSNTCLALVGYEGENVFPEGVEDHLLSCKVAISYTFHCGKNERR